MSATGVFRVVWLPGTDQLRGECHCGATQLADGPGEVWQWLLGHPVGHRPAAPRTPPTPQELTPWNPSSPCDWSTERPSPTGSFA